MSAASRTLRAPAATRRGNLGLAVLALVQLGLLALVLLTVARPPKTSSGPLLGKDVTVANIDAFTVTGSDGKSVTLKRDGTNWVLPDQGGYPAQGTRVKSFLQQLVGLQRSGLVATTADAYKRLKVTKDTYQKKVDLTLKSGGSETLLIGSEPSYGSTHVRLASAKGVYVTHALHASDARSDPSGYVDTTVLSLDPANLTRMEVRNANGDFVFTHAKSGWSMQGLPSGKQLDAHAVSTLAGSLSRLQLDEPLGKTVKPAYAFDKPLAVVTLTTVKPAKSADASGTSSSGTSSSGTNSASTSSAGAAASAAQPAAKPVTTTTTITVGAKDKKGFYPIRISDSPYVVQVSSSALGDVVGKKQADFIAKPASNGGSSGAAGAGSTGAIQRLTAPPSGSSGGPAGGGTARP